MSQLQISDLSFAYPGSPDTVFEGFDLRLDTGWRTGIVARNGRGKTTLLRLLARRLTPQAGSISPTVPTDFFPCDVPDPTLSTLEALESTAPDVESWRLYRELADLEVNEAVLARPFHTLSLGEQTRCLLALLFLREGHFLLIDEPTNHLDMASKEILESALNSYTGTCLFVSHDRYFINSVATRILDLRDGTLTNYPGDYDYYLEKSAPLAAGIKRSSVYVSSAADISEAPAPSAKEERLRQKEEQAKERKRLNEIARAEARIAEIDSELAEIDASLALEEVYTNPSKLAELSGRRGELESEQEKLYELWEKLENTD